MAKKVRFELDPKGIEELFKSPEVNEWLQAVGEDIARSAESMSEYGGEYGARAHNATHTAIVNVYPDSKEAAHDNYENNTLLKALGASGLPTTKPKL